MGTYRVLDVAVNEILTAIKPQQEDWRIRFEILNELRCVVGSVESLRGASVEPFGSFVSNLFTRWGDLDISIQWPNCSYVSAAAKKRKQNLLGDLVKALRQKGGWHRLQFIAHARVPILKLESSYRGISCDISIDNLQGHIKSKFLLWINEIDGRFRDLVLLIKEWAKSYDINNPKAGTFNSFSLSLLVIFHFQTCAPSILPPLRDIYPGNIVDDLKGVGGDAERQIAGTCAANIARFRSNKSANRSSISELFISFLAKFSGLNSKASELGICPYMGRWERLQDNTRWMPKTYALFIEDPFEQPENAARAVSTKQLPRISEVFELTHRRLISNSHNQSAVLNTLIRPQEVQYITRTPARNVGYNGGYFSNAPQIHRASISASPVQHQHQRIKRNNQKTVQPHSNGLAMPKAPRPHSNNFAPQIPAQQQQSRPQQVWRPRFER